jgi:valyl-tRNA synthetase
VCDKYGHKMSNVLGNVIDPLEVINGCTLCDLLMKIDAQLESANAKEL